MIRELVNNILDVRQHFRIVDALDILVIAVLLYGCLVWFKQAASRSVIVPFIVLTALYFVARTLDMYLTSLVFHTAFAVLLVVLVVLFQVELRRIFDRMVGWGTLTEFQTKTTALVEECDTLVEAVFSMAAERTGALIVLRGREPLDRHINGGIPLSARISKPILFSIFDSSSAGHDGAIIIERDRIESFGTHLPISKNHKEIKGRGTRHSAALGLAECSDAFTIVVSEERGVVSIAEQGRLQEMKTGSDLAGRLATFLEDRFPQASEDTWRRFVVRDWHLKITAIALAVLAWFVIAFSVDQVQTSVVVPIEYRNVPANAEIDNRAPTDALITLVGSERAFRQLDRRVLKISVDLSELREGEDTIQLDSSHVRVPPNLSVDRIQPNEIRVRLRPKPTAEQSASRTGRPRRAVQR